MADPYDERGWDAVGKLVRDRIPEVIEGRGGTARWHVLDDDETYQRALLDKLDEEADELHDAPPEARLEEAADVYEVLLAIAASNGFTIDDVARKAEQKRSDRGGFGGRIWLDSWD